MFLCFAKRVDVFSPSLCKAIEIMRPTMNSSKKAIGKTLAAPKSHWSVVYRNLKTLDVDGMVERFCRLNNGAGAIQGGLCRSSSVRG